MVIAKIWYSVFTTTITTTTTTTTTTNNCNLVVTRWQ